MRSGLIWLLSVAVLAGLAAGADAKAPAKKYKRHAVRQSQDNVAGRVREPQAGEYHEMDANKLPFGSSAWWDQMLREDRLTCCR